MNLIINNIKEMDKFVLFIYFYIFIMPWNYFKWQMGLLSIIMFIWWIIKYKKELIIKLKTIVEFKPLLILILFIFYSYITVFWSEDFSDGFKEVNKFYKYYFFIIPVLFTSLNKNEAILAIKVLVTSFAMYSLFSLLIYLGLFTIESTGSNISNPKGFMGYAIVTQFMAIGSISTIIFVLFNENKKNKVLFFIFSLLCLFSLFINNSRTAQIALIVSIFTILVIYYMNRLFKVKIIIALLGSMILFTFFAGYLLTITGKIDRFKIVDKELKNVIYENEFNGSLGLRIYFNIIGIEILKDYPLFGMGPVDNNNELENRMIKDPIYTNDQTFSSFHSEHMNTLTKYGIVGYLLLISSIGCLIYSLRTNREFFFISCSFFIPVFYISLANATFFKKPINYILISVFVLLSVIAYSEYKKRLVNDKTSRK